MEGDSLVPAKEKKGATMNGEKRESDNLRRRSNCRDRQRADSLRFHNATGERHAVRDNKCFPIIQPQNSYLEKGRKGREGMTAVWRRATPSGVSRLRRVSFEDIIYRKSWLQKRTDADGDRRVADSLGVQLWNGLSDG